MRFLHRVLSPSVAMVGYVNAETPAKRTPWRQASFCVVDLELSGLDPRHDEILSFGVVPVREGRVLAGEATYGLVRPTQPVPERSVLIHGIRTVDLATAPSFEEAMDTLLGAVTGAVVVAHVAEVERAFLAAAFRRLGLRLRKPIVDTQILGRLLLSERGEATPGWLSLSQLVATLGLPEHRPHHALGDALTTAQAFIALASHLDALHPETVGSLAHASDRLLQRRLLPR